MKDKRYFNIPIALIKQLHDNPMDFLNNVFDYGVCRVALDLKGSSEKRYKSALKFLNVIPGNEKLSMETGATLLKLYSSNGPYAGIEVKMFFDFYKNQKTEYEIECLAAFLAIRSIIGKKTYCKTNKKLIHARMFGYTSIKDLPKKLSAKEAKYALRWHMDKVLMELQVNWHLKLYSGHQRGMFVSFDLELPELIAVAEKSKQRYKIAEFRNTKKAIIEQTKLSLLQKESREAS